MLARECWVGERGDHALPDDFFKLSSSPLTAVKDLKKCRTVSACPVKSATNSTCLSLIIMLGELSRSSGINGLKFAYVASMTRPVSSWAVELGLERTCCWSHSLVRRLFDPCYLRRFYELRGDSQWL